MVNILQMAYLPTLKFVKSEGFSVIREPTPIVYEIKKIFENLAL